MPSGGPDLSDAGLDLSNYTVAFNFLQSILDDSMLQPTDYAMARAFWYGIVVVIFLAALAHWARWVALKARYDLCPRMPSSTLICHRLRAAAAGRSPATGPFTPVTAFVAACTAVVREVSYFQISLPQSTWIRVPPIGVIALILVYLAYVLGLQFYNVDYTGAQYWQARGLRATWLTMAQLPLLLLLAGKNNLVGYAVGVSYERLQVLHRWVARVMLLTATLHGAYQAYGWSEYGLLQIEISTDTCIPTGKSSDLSNTI